MRWSWVAVGVALAVVGVLLLYVPVVPQRSETATYSTSSEGVQYGYYRANVSGYSLSGTVVVDVSWTSNTSTSVQVIAAACTAACGGDYQHLSDVTNETGTQGRFVLDQPNGGSIVMGVLSTATGKDASVTFKITTAFATAGSVLVVAGPVLVIVGAVVRRRPARAAPTTPEPSPIDGSDRGDPGTPT